MVDIAEVSPAILVGGSAYDHVTDFLPLGDLNADGNDDLLVSSRWAGGQGSVYVFLGPIEGVRPLNTADMTIRGSGGDGVFGASLAGHDFDGDGLQDVLVGAYKSNEAFPDGGAVYHFRGRDLLEIVDPVAFAALPPLDTGVPADTGAVEDTDPPMDTDVPEDSDAPDRPEPGRRCGCTSQPSGNAGLLLGLGMLAMAVGASRRAGERGSRRPMGSPPRSPHSRRCGS